MSELLSFPKLGIHLHINPVLLRLGPLNIRWYGVLIATGFVLALWYGMRNTKRFGLDWDKLLNVVMGAVVGAVVGARLYYVAFTWDYYKANPGDIIRIWNGGLAIYGAVIGGLLTGWFLCKKFQVRFLPAADLAAGGFLIGQAIGRWGNFFNIEAFGGNTSLPWGMTSASIQSYLAQHQHTLAGQGMTINPAMPVHPTFLYESIWCALGLLVMVLWVKKHRRFDGEVFLFYIAWYGAGRSVFEGLRTDSLAVGWFRVSQWLAALLCVGAVVLWVWIRMKIKKSGDPETMKLYVDTPEGQSVVDGTFYKELAEEKKAAKEQREAAENENAARKLAGLKAQTQAPKEETPTEADIPEPAEAMEESEEPAKESEEDTL